MKIVLATPLYPPEIAEPAPYSKELATRLSRLEEVTIVAYTHLPERIPAVSIRVVEKNRPLFSRLLAFTFALFQETKDADFLIVINGASVELPTKIISLARRIPFVFARADARALNYAETNRLARILLASVQKSAKYIIQAFPPDCPEILPLEKYPREAFSAYEKAWGTHIAELISHISYEK